MGVRPERFLTVTCLDCKSLKITEKPIRRTFVKLKLTTTAFILTLAWPITQALAADADAGKAAYEKNCAGCHGADGKGNPAVAKTLGEKGLNIVGKETTA